MVLSSLNIVIRGFQNNSMLYRNGENLNAELHKYLDGKNNVTVFCPYIKVDALKRILDETRVCFDQIIVRWEPRDIVSGASDLEVYEVCKERNISLYINNRIHLKLFTNNFVDAFTGSANISNRGLSDNVDDCNYEICTYVGQISRNDRMYLSKIIRESNLVTEDLYENIQMQIDKEPDFEYFDLPHNQSLLDDFLISRLPMSDSPELIWDIQAGNRIPRDQQEENCFCHDLVLYDLNGLEGDYQLWFETLKNQFFGSSFIREFLKEVDSSVVIRNRKTREGLRFGAVRKWFSENTTSVPSPRPFELTDNVQILYRWIVDLSEGEYEVVVPGSHSQVIRKKVTSN